ncbi:MAG: sulfotransferase [Pseudomonadota bacterium]
MDEKTPIFVLGCARSGTTLVASLLSQSPQVANYRAESMLLAGCRQKYGSLANNANKRAFSEDWLKSRQFQRLGISRYDGEKILGRCNSYAELMQATLSDLAERQGKSYWLDSTPANVHALAEIAAFFPKARIVHIVRDGRAVAASLRKLGWTGVRTRSEIAAIQFAALKWVQALESYEKDAPKLSERIVSLRYEDLIASPETEVKRLVDFIGLAHFDLGEAEQADPSGDTARISANTAFGDVGAGLSTAPLTRWKKTLSPAEIEAVEAVGARKLSNYGYELVASPSGVLASIASTYRSSLFRSKSTIKRALPLRALYSTPLELADY